MRYLLLIYVNEAELTDDYHEKCRADAAKLIDELRAERKYVSAAPLERVAAATSVRVREGKTIVTDGPFAETREQLGGYLLIDAANLDEALAVAARFPVATRGTVEVRPIAELPGLPRG